VGTLLLLGTLAACSRPVEVAVPTPSAGAAAVCNDVMAALPGTVLDQPTADRTPESPFTAAWGSPPIVLRCGVTTPSGLQPTSQLATVNSVDWLPERSGDGYRFTTVGRTANVELVVPGAYAPEADALVDLAATVRAHDPTVIGAG
jgi:hypothetical protein